MSYEQEDNNGSGAFLGFILGAAAGIAAGILLAPSTGKDTREKLKNQATYYKDKVDQEVKRTASKVADNIESAVNKIDEKLKNS